MLFRSFDYGGKAGLSIGLQSNSTEVTFRDSDLVFKNRGTGGLNLNKGIIRLLDVYKRQVDTPCNLVDVDADFLQLCGLRPDEMCIRDRLIPFCSVIRICQ